MSSLQEPSAVRVPARLNERIDLFESPFRKLDAMLADLVPNPALAPLPMHVGEPQDQPPALLADTVAAHSTEWNRYPPSQGTPEFLQAVRGYLERRYPGTRGRIDPVAHLSSISSSREGLYLAASVAVSPSRRDPVALMPNPFYQAYRVAALMAGAQPQYLPHSGFPHFSVELAALDDATLSRTAIMTLCSPANPDGNILSRETMREAVRLARRHGFVLVFDECYAELYDGAPVHGALDVLAELDDGPGWLDNVIVLHSLSKRSCAAGMRSGFAVGDAAAITALNRLRLNGTACTPLPLFAAATALWSDETHVDAMRARLRARFDLADKWLGAYPGYYRPRAGFFLWLQVPDGVQMTRRLWSEAAVKVLAGEYLTQQSADGSNEGSRFIRIALVHDLDIVDEGLRRIAGLL